MQAAAGSVSWLAAQPSVLGRGGGAPSASVLGRGGSGGGGGGGGCRAPGVGVARCCARAPEKRPPRVRKTKEERRELVESFINNYRDSNDGKFPSVNLTHKEVGGSYYIVREIVRDIIQENRVLGPGGLDATTLTFEDCPDSSKSSMKHEFGQDNIEILDTPDDTQASKGSVSDVSSIEESFSLQNSAITISTQTLLGSSGILETGVLNSVVQNGSAAGATILETSLEKQDDLNGSEEKAPSFAHVPDSYKDVALDTLGVAHDGTASSVDGVILSPELSTAYETNGALLGEQDVPSDRLYDTATSAVDEANLPVATNGVLETEQTSMQAHDALPVSVSCDDVRIIEDQFSSTSTVSANSVDILNSSASSSETETTSKTLELSKIHSLHDEFEQSLLHASHDRQENSESLVSHPSLDTEDLLQMDKHSVVQVDESELNKSTPGMEELMASDATHEEGMSTTTAISRRTLKAHQKKDNLFWLVLRAFVVAISKIWAK